MSLRVAAAVITYNSAAAVGPCLESLREFADSFSEGVTVVDNDSQDDTVHCVTRFPGVQLVRNAVNRGFASAVNQAFELLPEADAVLILNPDVRLVCGIREMLLALEKSSRTGVVSGLLLDHRGLPQRGFSIRRFPSPAALAFETLGINRLWPSNPVNRHYRALDLDLEREQDVQQPAGAMLLIRRLAWRQLNGFDEGFHPVWFEDVDFLRRASLAGWRVLHVPTARAQHSGGHSIQTVCWFQRQGFWYGNLLRYTALHYSTAGRCMVCLAVAVSALPRAVAGMIRWRSWRPLPLYLNVFGWAVATLMSGSREAFAHASGGEAGQGVGPSGS